MAAAAQAQGTLADNAVWKGIKPYFNGGLSGMGATCIIQPIDMVKVRLQLGATGGPVSYGSMPRPCNGVDPVKHQTKCLHDHADRSIWAMSHPAVTPSAASVTPA
jgi:hypothetical protein